jgi:hypothetical protein
LPSPYIYASLFQNGPHCQSLTWLLDLRPHQKLIQKTKRKENYAGSENHSPHW